jgi:hypothetical protein
VPQFDFERDVQFSEAIEKEVIQKINQEYGDLVATKTTRAGYPDIEVKARSHGNDVCFIEIKGQARTFMSISRLLVNSKLRPSETVALNLSDLERYFEIFHCHSIPVYIVWCLMRRPCITGTNYNNKLFYYQSLDVLKQIRLNDISNCRRFRRATGRGDIVEGEHKGVVVNYHFSINELIPGLPDFEIY